MRLWQRSGYPGEGCRTAKAGQKVITLGVFLLPVTRGVWRRTIQKSAVGGADPKCHRKGYRDEPKRLSIEKPDKPKGSSKEKRKEKRDEPNCLSKEEQDKPVAGPATSDDGCA